MILKRTSNRPPDVRPIIGRQAQPLPLARTPCHPVGLEPHRRGASPGT